MMPLTISNSMLSKSIREKKKKMMESPPEMIGTSPTPDMNAQDIYDVEQHGRVEGTLMSEDKINADLTNIDEMQTYDGVGVSPEQKKRLGRLRLYLDSLPMWASNEGGMRQGMLKG
jgi:hypothetical protein